MGIGIDNSWVRIKITADGDQRTAAAHNNTS